MPYQSHYSDHSYQVRMFKFRAIVAAIICLLILAGIEQQQFGINESLYCRGHYLLPGDKTNRKYRDWKKEGHGTVDLSKAIEQSCDVYFYELAYRMGINNMHDFLVQFGFGEKTGIDQLGERSGLLPSTDWKKKKKENRLVPG